MCDKDVVKKIRVKNVDVEVFGASGVAPMGGQPNVKGFSAAGLNFKCLVTAASPCISIIARRLFLLCSPAGMFAAPFCIS